MQILVIDDDPAVLHDVAVMLQDSGCEVDRAESSDVALAHAQAQEYDFVFVGFMAPERDAVAFMQSVKLPRRTKVLFLTRVCNRHTIYRLFKMGIRGYVPLPCDAESLQRHLAFHCTGGDSGVPLPEIEP